MDPNATLSHALEAIAEQEWQAADEHLSNLLEWIAAGGFAPQVGAFTTQGSIDLYRKLSELVRSRMADLGLTSMEYLFMHRESVMLEEYTNAVPSDVRDTLAAVGFKPELDAGNLWFLDRDPYRLVFGEDGSDLPQSLDEPVTVCRKDMHDDCGVPFDTLRDALASISQG